MRRWILGISLLVMALPLFAQSTAVTATIQDSSGQLWANGSYSITFVPNPQQSGQYYWNGVPFAPQKYTGVMNGSGTMSLSLPDNGTITPAGSQWAFVLCANTSAPCSTVTTPVTGASQDFSTQFSNVVTPPVVFATPLVRAYSSSEVYPPPLAQGGQFYSVTDNIPYFWTGVQWIALGGTVSNVAAGNLPPIFTTTVTNPSSTPTINFFLSNAAGYNVLANCTASSAPPTYCQLNAAMIALAGTLSNNTTGAAGNVTGGYVSSISSASTQLTITPTQGNAVATLQTTGTEGKVVTAATAGTNGNCAQWDSSSGIGDSGRACVPSFTGTSGYQTESSGLIEEWVAGPSESANFSGPVTVTLPLTFPHACFASSAQLTTQVASTPTGNGNAYTNYLQSCTTTTVTVWMDVGPDAVGTVNHNVLIRILGY